METAMSQENLIEVFDHIIREVTEKVAGIRLYEGEASSGKDLCTVYAVFERGFCFGLSLCVETSLFIRLTQNIMEEEEVSSQDVEDFSKEYFNVLCGNIASRLFQLTKIASRFSIPLFYHGRYEPENQNSQFVLHYFSDQNEDAQLTYHMPM